jgi:magnesium chelatase subunit D
VNELPDAALVAALLAVDAHGLGGAVLRARAGPARDAWLRALRARLPDSMRVARLPAGIDDDRLLGGLDLTATLAAGRPVAQRGLLAEHDGGLLVVPMAERLPPGTAARLAAVLDTHTVSAARDGVSLASPCRIAVVALDEGIDDERPPEALLDRLAFRLGETALVADDAPAGDAIDAARRRVAAVRSDDDATQALCATAAALGIVSLRAPLLALRAACAAAALDGRDQVGEADLQLAARLVLGPRACRLPATKNEEAAPPPETPPEPPTGEDGADEPPPLDPAQADVPLEDLVLEAARAAIPAQLLERLRIDGAAGAAPAGAGRAGAPRASTLRGRPTGTRRGAPRRGARLALVDTLRAAAPWQPLRRRERSTVGRLDVRPEDFRVARFQQRSETTAVFAIDASGSSALHRLAEAKGAVELLLADCYVRRDRVAVIAFRQRGAELLLAPTRSLVRAKRCLSALPGGGGTPLAAGIDAAAALGEAVRRGGRTPLLVLLTDGRANVARDGGGGRARADDDARAAARRVRVSRLPALLVDTSPEPQPATARLAAEMAAAYLPLPHADATTLSHAVRARLAAGSA